MRISKEVRTAVSTDTTGITPLRSGLPGPATLKFKYPVESPAIQESCISMNGWETDSWRESETVPEVAGRAPVIKPKIVGICSNGPAIGAIHVERFGVGVDKNRDEPVEIERGQGDQKALVVGRYNVRKDNDDAQV